MRQSMFDVVSRLAAQADWFTLSKVVVRVAASLGGYRLEVDGPGILEDLQAMQEDGQLDEILAVSGIVHPPDRNEWVFAFRVDDSGPQVAGNAPDDALERIGPRLRQVVAP